MKKKFALSFFVIATAFSSLTAFGLVLESNKMAVVEEYANSETWVIFDVDNTLIESSLQIGSAQWRDHIRKKARLEGYDPAERELVLDKFWNFVQHFVPVNLVDKATLATLQKLKQEKFIAFALTAREPIELAHTQRQLGSVGIHFSSDAFHHNILLSLPFPGIYDHGVVYCGENTKGDTLSALLKETGLTPKRIVFVDDRENQITEVKQAVEQMGIEFIGVRFSGADARVAAFDPAIADLQWSSLPKVLSDEEAKERLAEAP